ncbi:MAG TPA: hypothetical protein VJ914_11650 [Pseudonocardiaceae bacterium]|nr:hypothetical protein [Pseudonocardiaceae bacterium]
MPPTEVVDAVRDDQDQATGQQESAPLPRAPWSAVWPEFIRQWGYQDGKFEPEHLEILGPTGSGKTYLEATILQERVAARKSAVVFIATKKVDATIMKLGWPIVDNWAGVKQHRQVIFWPRTKAIGEKRDAYLEAKIFDLLSRLWAAGVKLIVVFDEIKKIEELSRRIKALIAMFWREARSAGITMLAMKQRGQGVLRDMHSEAAWIAAFKPKHEEDAKFVGAAMGSWRTWLPVLQSLNRDKREFVLLHSVTGEAVISWVDIPLKPAAKQPSGVYGKRGQ